MYKLPSQWREKYRQKHVLPSFAARKWHATISETDTEVLIGNFFQTHKLVLFFKEEKQHKNAPKVNRAEA